MRHTVIVRVRFDSVRCHVITALARRKQEIVMGDAATVCYCSSFEGHAAMDVNGVLWYQTRCITSLENLKGLSA